MFDYMNSVKNEIINNKDEDMDFLKKYNDNEYDFKTYERISMLPYPVDYKTLFIKAPMKIGKTQKLMSHLKTIRPDINSIMAISLEELLQMTLLQNLMVPMDVIIVIKEK